MKRGELESHPLWTKLPTDRVWYPYDLEEAGFHKARLEDCTNWDKIHVWCEKRFGDNYTWTGNVFWFCSAEDALEFSLTWC